MAEWPSPYKLFLDIESEEDVQRRRAESESDGSESVPRVPGATGTITQSEEAVIPRDRPYSYRPSSAPASDLPEEPSPVSSRLVRERLFSSDIAGSRPVVRQPQLCSTPIRPEQARLELSPGRSQSYISALETLAQTLYSVSSVQAPVSGDRVPSQAPVSGDRVPSQPQSLSFDKSRPLTSADTFHARPLTSAIMPHQRAPNVDFQTPGLYSVGASQRPLMSTIQPGESSLNTTSILPPVCSLPTSWSSFPMASSSTQSTSGPSTGWPAVQRPLPSALVAAGSTPTMFGLPTSMSALQRSVLPPVLDSGSQRNGKLFGALGMCCSI